MIPMKHKKRFVLAIILLILFSAMVLLINYITISYNLSGTYSAGNEPDKENMYVVLKDEKFTIYHQEKVLESGLFEKINLNTKSDIYKLSPNYS